MRYIDVRLAGDGNRHAQLGCFVLTKSLILLEAERDEFKARVPVSIVHPKIPGLDDEYMEFEWKIARPPISLLKMKVLPFFRCMLNGGDHPKEAIVNLYWSGSEWKVGFPKQEATRGSVKTHDALPEGGVIQIHSHGHMRPFFSTHDNRDEKGFLIYGVIGSFDKEVPQALFRIGINGYWLPLEVNHVFSCR